MTGATGDDQPQAFCTQCGAALSPGGRFCVKCGRAAHETTASSECVDPGDVAALAWDAEAAPKPEGDTVVIDYGWPEESDDGPTPPPHRISLIATDGRVIDVDPSDAESGATLGRDRSRCVVAFPDGRISRRHCTLIRNGALVTVRDLGSRNGTFVNGVRTSGDRPLVDGDTLRIGRTELVVRIT